MAVVDRPRRVRPWLRNVAIVAFLVLLPIAAHTAWDHYEARRFARVVADVRARNEPIAVPGSEQRDAGTWTNAARYYDAAAALVVADDLYSVVGLVHRVERGTDAERRKTLEDIRVWLERNREGEELLAKATDMPFERYAPGTGYNYRFDRLQKLARLADFRAKERLEAGDGEAAAQALVQELRLSRPMRAADPLDASIAGLHVAVTPALRQVPTLLRNNISDTTLERLQTAVREQDDDKAVERATAALRATVLEQVWNEPSRWYRPPRTRGAEGVVWYAIRPFMTRRLIRSVNLQTDLLTHSRLPWPARLHVDVRDQPPDPSKGPRDFSGVNEEWSVRRRYKGTALSVATALALVRTSDAALAIERYRRANGGAIPDSLSQLVPALLPSVPIDPFSGREIVYRRTPDGCVVYSLGVNQKDDGGTKVEYPVWGSAALPDRGAPPDLGVALALSSRPR